MKVITLAGRFLFAASLAFSTVNLFAAEVSSPPVLRSSATAEGGRERLLLDFGWKFQSAPAFDVKRFLHPGENDIAVAVANWNGAGGINKGVTLQLGEKPEMPQWKRSAFNGLAQIIVQSTKDPGEIKLIARSKGLLPAMAVIQSQPCTPRPCVP